MYGNYKIVGEIGTTPSSKVKLGENQSTGEKVAIKTLKIDNLAKKPKLFAKLQREIALMHLMDHPHIIRCLEVFESQRHLHIVQEYAPKGELFDHLKKQVRLPEPVAMNFFRQIIFGLEYLHQHNICHRDLKPENILLDEFNQIKIAGLLFARWMKDDIAQTCSGTPQYAAPEVLKGQPFNGRAADIWSAGCVLYVMLAGKLPFDAKSLRMLIQQIKDGKYEMPNFSPSVQNLISKILIVDPTKRYTIEQIKRHPAFYSGLPGGYVIPTPLPLPLMTDPIDPSSVDTDVIQLLKSIGYGDDQGLRDDLISTEHTMAKVFVFMLTKRAELSSLPWESSSTFRQNIVPQTSEQVILAPDEDTEFDLRTDFNPISTPANYSLALRAEWAFSQGQQQQAIYEQEESIAGISNYTVPQLAHVIQVLLEDNKAEWFYPDDFSICAKMHSGAYVTFGIIHNSNEEGQLVLCCRMSNGSAEEFTAITRRISNTVLPEQISGTEIDINADV